MSHPWLSPFSRVQLFLSLWTVAHQPPWVSPGKNTGVVCHALLQGIFLGIELHLLYLLHWQEGSLPLVPPRSHPLQDKIIIEARNKGETCLFKADSKATITVKFYCTMKSLGQIPNQMGNQGRTHKLVLFWAYDHTIESLQNRVISKLSGLTLSASRRKRYVL